MKIDKDALLKNRFWIVLSGAVLLLLICWLVLLLSNAGEVVQAFDPQTGRRLWSLPYEGNAVTASVVNGDGLVFASPGYGKSTLRALELRAGAASPAGWRCGPALAPPDAAIRKGRNPTWIRPHPRRTHAHFFLNLLDQLHELRHRIHPQQRQKPAIQRKRLLALTRRARSNSATDSFGNALTKPATQPTAPM